MDNYLAIQCTTKKCVNGLILILNEYFETHNGIDSYTQGYYTLYIMLIIALLKMK